MQREIDHGQGSCLGLLITTTLIVLVIGAAFGFFEWSTVGKFVRILVYIGGALLVIFLLFLLFIFISTKIKR